MAEPLRWQIMQAVSARLAALSQFRLVEIGRDTPVSESQYPAVLIDDAGQAALSETAVFQRFELRLAITVLARGGQGGDVIRALSAHHAAVIAALYSDQDFGGLVEAINQGDVDAPVLADGSSTRAGEMTFRIGLEFGQAPGDPFTRAG